MTQQAEGKYNKYLVALLPLQFVPFSARFSSGLPMNLINGVVVEGLTPNIKRILSKRNRVKNKGMKESMIVLTFLEPIA